MLSRMPLFGVASVARHAPDTEKAGGASATSPALPPDALIILPVRSLVLFPGVVFPITIGRANVLCMRSAASLTSSMLCTFSITTTNSSPPWRATVSD